MNPPLRAAGAIRSTIPELNRVTDEAAELVRDIEAFLNHECQYECFAAVTVALSVNEQTGEESRHRLTYQLVGNKYRIVYVIEDSDDREIYSKPWAECSRARKLESFRHVPELLTEIAREMTSDVQEAAKSITEVRALLSELRHEAGKNREKNSKLEVE